MSALPNVGWRVSGQELSAGSIAVAKSDAAKPCRTTEMSAQKPHPPAPDGKAILNTKAATIILCIVITFVLVASGGQSAHARNRYEGNIELAGDILQVVIPAAAYVTTVAMDDDEGRGQLAKSLIVNVSVTYGLKLSIDKDRPEGNGDFSFPSAHSSSSFQGATFLYKRYGWKFGVPAYIAAAFVAYSRKEADKHDAVDVLSGASIGFLSSYLFTTPYKDVTVLPVAGNGYYGVQLNRRW